MTEINKWTPICPDCISETPELAASLPERDKELEGLSMTQGWRGALRQAWHMPLINLLCWGDGISATHLPFVRLAGGTAGHRVKVAGLSIHTFLCSRKGTGFLRSDGGLLEKTAHPRPQWGCLHTGRARMRKRTTLNWGCLRIEVRRPHPARSHIIIHIIPNISYITP